MSPPLCDLKHEKASWGTALLRKNGELWQKHRRNENKHMNVTSRFQNQNIPFTQMQDNCGN